MNYVAILQLILQLVALFVKEAQKKHPEEGAGAIKKEEVTDGINAIFSTLESISTGGQAETLTKIKPIVSPAIDVFASFLFPKEER